MLSYFFPQKNGKANERDKDAEARSQVDKHAKQFDESPLARAMKVHTVAAKIYYEPNVIATKEDVEGVPEAFIIHNALTPRECEKYIEITEGLGFTDAPISTGLNSAQMMKDVRDNLRVMWQATPEMMNPIWERIKTLIPATVTLGSGKEWHIVNEHPLNERFRFYRYDEKQIFQPHFDGCFPRKIGEEQSHFTLIIYLNDGFDGGETTFFPGNINSMWNAQRKTHQEKRVNPKVGSALLFRHSGVNSPLHEGSPHRSPGMRKYVLRTDVMYRASN